MILMMKRFQFVTWAGGGNLYPAVGIGVELAKRGHSISFLGEESQRSRIEGAGIAFTPYARMPGGRFEPPGPEDRLGHLIDDVWLNTDLGDDVIAELEERRPNIVIVDCMLVGVLARSAEFGVPTAVLVHGLFQSVLPMRDFLVSFGNQRRVESARPSLAVEDLKWENKDLVVVTSIHELDGVTADPAPNVRYVGPVLPPASSSRWPLPWDDDGTPLVLASLSTMPGQGDPVLAQRILDALGTVSVHVVMTTGALPPETLTAPPNAVVCSFAPHQDILPRCDVMITHGGHGSVMGALAKGVPLVCIPGSAADQPIVAGRVEQVGAGRTITANDVPEELPDAVRKVTTDDAYRHAAQHLQKIIALNDGPLGGASVIERWSGVR